jgi:hypothetical protein
LAIPFTAQFKPTFVVPVTMGAICRFSPVPTTPELGESDTRMPESMVTVAEPVAEDAAWLVAVTVTVGGLGSAVGAW